MIFKSIEIERVLPFDPVRSYIDWRTKSNISATVSTQISLHKMLNEKQNTENDLIDVDMVIKEIGSDHLWKMLLSVKPKSSPNLRTFISFFMLDSM
jgi:hypothetical protein